MSADKHGFSGSSIVELVPGGALWLGGGGEPMFANDALAAMVGMAGMSDKSLVLEMFSAAEFRDAVLGGGESFGYACLSPCGQGLEFDVRLKKSRLGGQTFYVAAVSPANRALSLMRAILDAAPIHISVFSSSYHKVDCNAETLRAFSFGSKPFYLENFYKFMPIVQPCGRVSKKIVQECIDEALASGRSVREIVKQRCDGTLVPTECIFVCTEVGRDKMVFCYSRNIAEVKRVLAKERDAVEAFNLFMETAPFGIEIWNDCKELVDCNYQVAEIFGIGSVHGFKEYVKREGEGNHIQHEYFNQAIQYGFSRYEWEFVKHDGTKLPCELKLVSMRRDRSMQVFVYVHDLSEVRIATNQANEADIRAKMMLDSTPISCFLLRENFTAIDCNKAAVKLFGFANKAQAIARFRDIFPRHNGHGPSGNDRNTLQMVEFGSMKTFEYVHRNISTGEDIPCEVNLYRLTYQDQPLIAAYLTDLREIKAMVAEMKRIDIAEEESRAKSQFLARMSHEIRTPMNAIVGVTDIQLRRGGHGPSTEEAFLQIKSSSNILLSIINDILDLSKIAAGKMEVFNEPYEVAGMIYDTTQLVVSQYVGSKNVELMLSVSEDIPTVLCGDEIRVKQVLNNLLSNAFKYTMEGSVTVSFSYAGGNLLVLVEDTGQGMTESQIGSLFANEYVRFNELNNRVIEGTGLGMNITNGLVKIMDGDISATSALGMGTKFRISIPQSAETADKIGYENARLLEQMIPPKPVFVKSAEMDYEPMPYGKVLVVDDVETNLLVARGYLSPYQLEVDTAFSGFEALELVAAGNVYDIIFMDHMMPVMDGIETTKKLREMGYGGPVVALTANVVSGQAEIFERNGFSGFISKPINVGALENCLKRLVRDAHPEREMEMEAAQPRAETETKTETPGPQNSVSKLVVESFLRDARRAIELVDGLRKKILWMEEDFLNFTTTVHGVKSALANVQEHELSEAAGGLEEAGRERDFDAIMASVPAFLRGLDELVEKFRATDADGAPEEDGKPEDIELLWGKLKETEDACLEYDRRAARIALAALEGYKWSGSANKLIEELNAKILHSEFEEAAEAIAEFLTEDA